MARHNDTGKWGEELACEKLVTEGYAIVGRNWRMNHLEIDIVAQKGTDVVFAEVKTRTNMDEDPLEAIDKRKISNMARAAGAWLHANDTIPTDIRFDVFAINGTPENYRIEHLPDAFTAPIKTY